MAWILLEGLDRSGKSSVAEIYKKQGYEVVHMEAPNKKYFQPGYSGPSYLEEIVDMYSIYDGKNVVFDRTIYGEYIWPEVYNRMPMLNEDDVEYLSRLEYNNNVTKILMYDEDVEAHWQRCVDNKEPLTRLQFVQASRLYDKLATKHNFQKTQLSEFSERPESTGSADAGTEQEDSGQGKHVGDTDNHGSGVQSETLVSPDRHKAKGEFLEEKLARANAIRVLLKNKIVKKSGEEFERLEEDIKNFLTQELENIFTPKQERHFTKEEIQILKLYAGRIIQKSTLKE
jgi:thymidylate kinase